MATTPSAQQGTGSYQLRRSYIDSIRLNLGHFLWKKSFPYITHPSIDLSNPDLAICEVGTGTGIWLLELSEQLAPTTTLVGFDNSLHQFPKPHLTPPNVSIKYLDIHEDIPEEHQGRFDVVNMRFMIALVKDNDPAPFLRNALKLLKPGGWIQWGEVDFTHHEYLGVDELKLRLEDTASYRLNQIIAPYAGKDVPQNWSVRLPDVFSEEGLVDVQSERKPVGGGSDMYALYGAQTLIAVITDFVAGMPDGEKKAEMANLLSRVEDETSRGLAWRAGGIQLVGRKPF